MLADVALEEQGGVSVAHVAILRFLVAMGTGGEWAVAAALVAEVFPRRGRAHASGIFHASSVLGVAAAAGTGMLVGGNWRLAYLLGLAPGLLVLWMRRNINESEAFEATAHYREKSGTLHTFGLIFAQGMFVRTALASLMAL